LMNCTIKTFRPCPTAHIAVPETAVVFPLPGTVGTMINPFRLSGKLPLPRVRKPPQDGEPTINLFEQKSAGQVVG
jgi:hypothetical protein